MAMGQMQKTILLNVKTSEELWPYQVVDEIQKVMEAGEAKHPGAPWKEQSADDHVTAAMLHLIDYGDIRQGRHCNSPTEDKLAHAFTRLMMAMAIDRSYVEPTDKEDADA